MKNNNFAIRSREPISGASFISVDSTRALAAGRSTNSAAPLQIGLGPGFEFRFRAETEKPNRLNRRKKNEFRDNNSNNLPESLYLFKTFQESNFRFETVTTRV